MNPIICPVTAALLLSGVMSVTSASAEQIDQIAAQANNEPIEQLTVDVEHMHPIAMYVLAKREFDAGNLNEAVFWYYEGKLRWQAYLRNNPTLQGPMGEEDRYSVFNADISPDIDWCGSEDVPNLLKLVERALDWDAAHPDDFTPNESAAKQKTREGFKQLIAETESKSADIKKAHDEKLRSCPLPGREGQDDLYSGNGGALFGKPDEMVSSYETSRFDAFQIGRTKKGDVIKSLGPPELWMTEKDGTSTLSYSYHKAVLAGMGLSQRVVVSFRFDSEKILTAIELPKDKSP